MSSDADRQLEALLARAGDAAQPRDPGWDDLRDRLERIPQVTPVHRSARRWLAGLGAAAMIGLVISLWLAAPTALVARDAPIRVVRKNVEITVFSEAETDRPTLYQPMRQNANPRNTKTGMGMVKDHRLVMNLKRGDNVVRFTDVAATIDPTSVRLVSDTDPLGTAVVEQNFEYDLLDADALLKRYIERPIVCVDREDKTIEGYLLSYDADSLVLADSPPREAAKPQTQVVARNTLLAVRMAEVPDDLFTRPTLVWTLRTDRPGQHDMTLSYLCGDVKWRADYVIGIEERPRDQGDRLTVKGWVTIENRSGSTYADAGIKLIAGDVNRVPDPWAVVKERRVLVESLSRFGVVDRGRAWFRPGSKEFIEKSFFEYHLYTLTAPSTVRDRQIKQLNLLRAEDVTAQRRYVYDATRNTSRPRVELVIKNEKANHLGLPLPKGRVTFMQRDADGELQFVSRDEIDHTPVDEELELFRGYAFDVVGERTVVDTKRRQVNQLVETIRLLVRSHKDEAITVRCIEHPRRPSTWKISETSDPWRKHDVNTVHFDFVLEPNAEKSILYTVEQSW